MSQRKATYSIEGDVLTVTFLGIDEAVVFDTSRFPGATNIEALRLGYKIRVQNGLNKSDLPETNFAKTKDLLAQFQAGEWTSRKGTGKAGEGKTMTALVAALGDAEAAHAFYSAHTDALKGRSGLVVIAISRLKKASLDAAVERWEALDEKTRKAIAKTPAVTQEIATLTAALADKKADDALKAFVVAPAEPDEPAKPAKK